VLQNQLRNHTATYREEELHNFDFYGFVQSGFVMACTDEFYTLVSYNKFLNDFGANFLNCNSVLANISSERA
jgi:hypothetical protein